MRAFATEAGRNLFLYEERPEAFVPGAVRTRLALLGARLPPGAATAPARAGLAAAPVAGRTSRERLRGQRSLGRRTAARPGRGPPALPAGAALEPPARLRPPAAADRARRRRGGARDRARAIVESLLPRGPQGPRRGPPGASTHRPRAAAKALGGVYHAERFWLFLPSGDGLPEVQHPLELSKP